jgi:DNA-binding XRE family transcriptional regulator
MTHLRTYLEETGTRQSDFADLIGVTQATVSKIAEGGLTPSLKVAAAIEAATKGKVKAISFVNNPNSNEAA